MSATARARTEAVPTIRRILRVSGIVQGVGFRPFVFRVATELGLRGGVWNESGAVVIDVEGGAEALDALTARLVAATPPRAMVERVEVEHAAPADLEPFRIRDSAPVRAGAVRVSADLATCPACLRELGDPGDRRFRYPFLNCTDCGPRYSIARSVPYDRPRTTMSAFTMCEPCASEYRDPASRRFHAQPNACPDCGPQVWVEGSDRGNPIETVVSALRRGAIAAIKGLGGFHLACDARDRHAVASLRERKRRSDKPLAVMVADLAAAQAEAEVEPRAREALSSSRRPIVLLPQRDDTTLTANVAPGLRQVGLFLPYTPLHQLLMGAFGGPLVMTSGNFTEEPIAATNSDALERLAAIADVFLLHDREIHMREDDSVVWVQLGKERVLRRSRGHVPEPIALGFDGPAVLAVGADLKNTLCLTDGAAAILSQHIGDLEAYETQLFFEEVRGNLERLFGIEPRLVAHDLHPGYHSTALAVKTGLPRVAVQHHHAHIASCLVDNGRRDRVIGIAWDGTGYGTDSTIWGGEILLADLGHCDRVGRIRPVAMPGGDSAVREPWRMAVSHLLASGLTAERVGRRERARVESMIDGGVNVVATSSAGRLFDAVASLLGLRDVVSYEGQAAMELEAAADEVAGDSYPLPVVQGEMIEIDPRPLVRQIVADLDSDEPVGRIAGRFHRALARAVVESCRLVRQRTGLSTVALSGGCFQNRLLTELVWDQLDRSGFEVLLHARVPPNDGGISLGQAAVAAWRAVHVPGDPR